MSPAALTIHQAVELLVGQLRPVDGDLRTTKDRIRKRIVYALIKGKLRHATLAQEGLDKNELIVWAKRKWPGKIKLGTAQFVEVHDSVKLSDSLSVESYPGSLDECHRLLRDVRRQLTFKDLRYAMLMGEAARYRADAERYRLICEKNKFSAKLPRK